MSGPGTELGKVIFLLDPVLFNEDHQIDKVSLLNHLGRSVNFIQFQCILRWLTYQSQRRLLFSFNITDFWEMITLLACEYWTKDWNLDVNDLIQCIQGGIKSRIKQAGHLSISEKERLHFHRSIRPLSARALQALF